MFCTGMSLGGVAGDRGVPTPENVPDHAGKRRRAGTTEGI
jgi:hypothetical protein